MITEQIKKIFAEKPHGHPSRAEIIQIKKAIFLLAEELDRQNKEMVTVYRVAQKIMVAIGKLDEKFEKAGL